MSADPTPAAPVAPAPVAPAPPTQTAQIGPNRPTFAPPIGESPDIPDATDPHSTLPPLSDRQFQALDLVLQGKAYSEIATILHVGRRTLYTWRNLPAFRAHYDLRRRELCDAASARILTLVGAALDALDRQVHERYTPTSHRAAQTLLHATAIGRHATTFPPTQPPQSRP